jgi:electron transfer flavoprotein beta subunit
MDIVVCVKNVPFTQEADLVLAAGNTDVRKDNLAYVINEWDNYAAEEAVRLKETMGGTVTAVTVGSEDDEEVLRRCLAMGADRAVRVDPGDLALDASVIAALLAAAVRPLPRDLVLTGVQADDMNHGVVGPLLAERLQLPHISVINGLSLDGALAEVTVELDGGQEESSSLPLPALFSIQTGINEPRYVSIMGIRKAAKIEIEVMAEGRLGLSEADLAPDLILEEMYPPPETGAAEMLEGDSAAMAAKILAIVREKVGGSNG